jgi:hypothetical protein
MKATALLRNSTAQSKARSRSLRVAKEMRMRSSSRLPTIGQPYTAVE